jgi:hypothetical protein
MNFYGCFVNEKGSLMNFHGSVEIVATVATDK